MTVPLVLLLAAILAAAVAARAAARVTRLPVIPLYVAAGYLLARGFTVTTPPEGVQDLLLLCLAFLLFSGGLALNPGRFLRTGLPRILGLAVAEVAIMGAVGAAVMHAAGYDLPDVVQGAFAVAFSSTLLVGGILAARGGQDIAHAAGRLALGFLLLQDAIAIAALAFMPPEPLTLDGLSLSGPASHGLALIVLCGATWVLMRHVLPRLLLSLRRDPEDRTLLTFGLLFLSLVGVSALGLPAIVGPFFAGVALSPHPSNVLVRGVTRSVREFFIPVFFVTLGLFLVPVEGVPILLALLLLAIILVGKPLVVALLARASGSTHATAIEAGLLVGQGSEFALALLLTALTEGAVSPAAFGLLATVITLSFIVNALIPPRHLARAISRRLPHRAERHYRSTHEHPTEEHVVILGAGTLGRAVAAHLEGTETDLVLVEHDPQVAREAGRRHPTLQGEGSDPRVLAHATADRADAVAALMGRSTDNLRVLDHVDPARAIVRVTTPEEAAAAVARGAVPIEIPAIVAEEFLRRFDRGRPPPV